MGTAEEKMDARVSSHGVKKPMMPVAETVLVVDDEESVRRTLREWLDGAGWGIQILAAADAEQALVLAHQQPIDLAILDWNLGAGNDGLRLLEDLSLFHPDLVAILVTGYAHQATPLDALRMGVRDYFDKNQDFNREAFLASVRRQLDRIAPAKRERRLNQELNAFREAVRKVVPLVQATTALNDPVPLTHAVSSLMQFLTVATGASDGFLLAHGYDAARVPSDWFRVYDASGRVVSENSPVPFSRSLAGSVVNRGEVSVLRDLDELAAAGTVELQAFECSRRSFLASAFPVGPGLQVVLELFDKRDGSGEIIANGFAADDRHLLAAATDFGSELLRHALSERQSQQLLLDALGAALAASESIAETLRDTPAPRQDDPPPAAIMDRLRDGLHQSLATPIAAEDALRLVEAIRVLALRHGPVAVRHCTRLVEDLRTLLDSLTRE